MYSRIIIDVSVIPLQVYAVNETNEPFS